MSAEKKIIDQQQVGQLTWSADGRTSAQVYHLWWSDGSITEVTETWQYDADLKPIPHLSAKRLNRASADEAKQPPSMED